MPADWAQAPSQTVWITLAQASRLLPTRPSISTLWRWCRKGLRGVKLEYRRLGDRLLTSESALDAFMQRLTKLDAAGQDMADPDVPSAPTSGEIERRLREEGLL